MNGRQFIYHMQGLSKTYPGGKKVFENIRLNFLPGVKIGGQWRFRRALLDEYLDTLASESVATSGATPTQVIDASSWRRAEASANTDRSSPSTMSW